LLLVGTGGAAAQGETPAVDPADVASVDDSLRAREQAPRSRKPLEEFVFTDRWGNASTLLARKS
jgi:hypothetical protein